MDHKIKSDALLAARSQEVRQDCIGLRLRMFNRVVNSIYEKELGPYGLSISQVNIMTVLVETGAISPTKIAEYLRVEKSTLSRNLKLMEKLGWVVSKSVGREVFVEMTSEGKSTYSASYEGWKRAQAEIEKSLSKKGIDALHTLFSKLEAFK